MNTTSLLWQVLTAFGDVIATGIPDGEPTAPPGLEPKAGVLIGMFKWLGFVGCILGFIAGALVWAYADRHAGGAEKLVKPIVGVILISGAVGIIGFFA